MKHCPKCGSSRIRHGYAYDPLIVRMLGFRELLCDGCNLRFRGFVIPGTLPKSGRHKKKPQVRSTPEASVRSGEQRAEQGAPAPPPPRVKARSDSKRCPGCFGYGTHRSHRRGTVENLASLIGFYPFRCDDCSKRFLSRRPTTARDDDAA
jgi:transposase-like protein